MRDYRIQETAVRIRRLRIDYGYTQEKAAELLDTDRRLLSHIENGTKGCSVDMLLRLSEVYGTTVDYLLTGRDLCGDVVSGVLEQAIETLTALRNKL